jgi:hypothetical protein
MRAVLMVMTLALLAASPAQAAGVALVTDLAGKVEAEGGAAAPGILSELDAGLKLRLAQDARVTLLYLASGEEYQLKGAGRYQIGSTAPAALQGAQPEKRKLPVDALPGVRVKPSSVAQATLMMRSIGRPPPKLLAPLSTMVLADRPPFRWEGVAGAEKYRLRVVDSGGQAVAELETAETAAQLPEGVRLKEGAAYAWSVDALLGEGRKTTSRGEFGVLGAEQRARLERMRPAADAKFSERVVYALLLDQYEVRDAAREEWRKLSVERQNEALLKERAGQ